MLLTKEYNRNQAVAYARKWAFARNPVFYDFSDLGGDCTNFISQCVYAGACEMNYTPTFGWFFISPSDRSPSWSGVEFLYQFLTTNQENGPFGVETPPDGLETGDIIQLGDANGRFYHTLLVSGFAHGEYLVAAHTNDAFDRLLSSYSYQNIRFLHILGVRYEQDAPQTCPDYMR